MFSVEGFCLIETLEHRVRAILEDVKPFPEVGAGASLSKILGYALHEVTLQRGTEEIVLAILETLPALFLCSARGEIIQISKTVLGKLEDHIFEDESGQKGKPVADCFTVLTSNWIVSTPPATWVRLPPGQIYNPGESLRAGVGLQDHSRYLTPSPREEEIRNVFHNFNGWVLTFRDSDFPSDADIRALCGDDDATKSKGGRPSKQAKVRRVYPEIYPNGHEGVPLKSVANAVSKAIGETVSVATIKRALKTESKPDQN